MSDPSDGPSAPPTDQLQPPEAPTSTFSKIVATCLHDLRDLSDVWYSLTQSDREETAHTLAGMSLKSLLNDAMKDENVRKLVWKIVAENEPIPLSKVPYLVDHPELFKDICKILVQLPIQGMLGIEVMKSKGRLVVKKEDAKIRDPIPRVTLAEFSVGNNFQMPLYYAHHATELATDFRISVLGGDRQSREEDLNKIIKLYRETSNSDNGKCDVRCYRESKFHFNDDQKGSNVYYKLLECHFGNHLIRIDDVHNRPADPGPGPGLIRHPRVQNRPEDDEIRRQRIREFNESQQGDPHELEIIWERRNPNNPEIERRREAVRFARQLQRERIQRRREQRLLDVQEMEVEEGQAPDDQDDVDALDQNRRRGGIQRAPDDVIQNDEQLGVAVIRRHLIGINNPLPPPPLIQID